MRQYGAKMLNARNGCQCSGTSCTYSLECAK
jgi:hypothetical protein